MDHPAELAIHQYLQNAANGKSEMSEETIQRVATEVADALKRQFGSGNKRDEFTKDVQHWASYLSALV